MKPLRLLLAIVAVFALPAQAQAPGVSASAFEGRLLSAHNRERARFGFVALTWSPTLAQQAASWAQDLARRGAFEHSRERQGAGENLWMGTSGYYGPEDMIGAFVKEGQYFRPGKFPDVSTTGNWADVGHYTQLIWPATRELGCAVASTGSKDILVCRYFPAGNMRGQQVP